MEIYLIRHGIAVEATEYEDDRIRPLTEKGRSKTKQVAERLAQLEVKFDLLLTSPLVRAKQTTEILAPLANKVEESLYLAPEGKLSDWLKQFQPSQKIQTLALVGHQPDLGTWAEQMVWGKDGEKLILKKAGIIGIELPIIELGQGNLFLLASPKWLLV